MKMDIMQTKALIRSITQSSPELLTLHRLNRDFKEEEGNYIPYREFGYDSLESFLRSIPDTVLLRGTGPQALVYAVASEKSFHIQELVANQNKSRKRPRQRTGGSQFQQRNINRYPQTKHIVQKFAPPHTKNYEMKPHALYPTPTPTPNIWQTGIWQIQQQQQAQFRQQANIDHFWKMQFLVNQSTQQQQYNIQHQQRFQENKKTQQKQWQNLANAQSTKPLQTQEHKKTEDKIQMKCDQNKKSTEPKALPMKQENISIPVKQLLKEKEAPTKTENEIVIETQKFSEGISKMTTSINALNLSCSSLNCSKKSSNSRCQAVPDFAVTDLVCRLDFPDYTVKYGEKLKQCRLPSYLKKDVNFGLYVTEMHNPFKFWFHIDKDNHELDVLMNNIGQFYSELSPIDLKIPEICIVPSQICAATYNGLWHRACILTSVMNNKVKVYFVDYGTVAYVDKDEIKYLATKFSYLPMQAYRGSFSCIKPKGSHWTTDTTKVMLEMVFDKLLYAKVSEINEEHQIVYMIVCDSNDENNIVQLNTKLVEMEHALLDENWREDRIKELGSRFSHPRELYPSFDMLERGEYPTLQEIVGLLHEGIHFERMIDNRVYSPFKLGNAVKKLKDLPFEVLATNPFRYEIIKVLHNRN